MQIKYFKILSIFLFIISISPVIIFAKEKKQMRINWDELKKPIKYRVQIKDENDKLMLDEETEVNYLDFLLPVGKYKLRIGSVNKFNKINMWSEWKSIEIKIGTKKQARKSSKQKMKTYDLELIKLGVGYSYFFLLPEWSSNYISSYLNTKLNVGLYFGGFSKLKKFWFFKHFGSEIEFNYIKFDGVEGKNVVSDLHNIVFGFNLYMRTTFKFPINIIMRLGGGLVYTIQNFKKYDTSGNLQLKGELESIDFYYKPEISCEFRAAKIFYIEFGIGFESTLYKDKTMYSLSPFIILGFTF